MNNLENSEVTSESEFAIQADVMVFKATDYSKFILSELNRNPGHYKKVMESIEKNDYTMYQPILVNRKMEIVDGQNRYLACKELGLPIYFIVAQDIEMFAAAEINQAAKNWTASDYVQHYAKRGRPEYIKFLDYQAKYGMGTSTLSRFGHIKHNSSYAQQIKSGDFQFKNGLDIDTFFIHHRAFKKYYHFAGREMFIKSLFKVYSAKNYNMELMIDRLRTASGVVNEQPNLGLMVKELVKLYNFNAGKKQKIDVK